MRNFKWYTWLGMVFLFVICTIVFVKIFSSIGHMAHSETMKVKVESEEIDHRIQLETETKEAGSLTSVKSIPLTQIEEIDKPIKEWATKEEKAFFSDMENTEILLDHNASAHFSLQTKVYPLTDNLYHIAISTEQSADQINDYNNIKTFTIDLEEEKLVDLDQLTKDKLTPVTLFKLLQKNSDSDLDSEKFDAHFETLKHINWTAGEKNIVFYFRPNTISANKEKIVVPLLTFYTYLKDPYYSALISDKLTEKIKQKEEKERQERKKEKREKRKELQNKKKVALTFDDGPDPDNTLRILKTLDKYGAKATFFALANNVKQYPSVAKKIIDHGHELGNHSISHANLNAVKKDKAKSEIVESQSVIEKLTGKKTDLYRPPYGNFDNDIKTMIDESGQEIILWSLDTEDWKNKNAKSIYQTVKNNTVPGSIVLMHDIHPTTADALPKILKYYKEEGYEPVTVSELLPYIEDTYNEAYFGQ